MMEINWPIVALRIVDGFLYGTGFVMAMAFWLMLFDRKKEKS